MVIINGNGELEDRYIADFIKTVRDNYFIAPFTFIFIYDVYKKSTEDQVNYCHANLTKFVIGCSDYFKQYWRE